MSRTKTFMLYIGGEKDAENFDQAVEEWLKKVGNPEITAITSSPNEAANYWLIIITYKKTVGF